MAFYVHPANSKWIINLGHIDHLFLKKIEENVDDLDDFNEEKYFFMIQVLLVLTNLESVVAYERARVDNVCVQHNGQQEVKFL